jgi:hypothetical protein
MCCEGRAAPLSTVRPGRTSLDHTPNDFRAEAVRRYSTALLMARKTAPNVTTLSDQVSEYTVFFPLLQVSSLGGSQLGPPQAGPKEYGRHGMGSGVRQRAVHQELPLQVAYLAAENRILRAHCQIAYG